MTLSHPYRTARQTAVMASNNDEKELYEDLKGFLVSPRADLRLAATDAVLQHVSTGDQTVLDNVVVKHVMVPLLAKNIAHPDASVAVKALRCLLFLSSCGSTANKASLDLLEASGLNRLLEVALSSAENREELQAWKNRVCLAMSLLANLTRSEEGSIQMAGTTMPEHALAVIDESTELEGTRPPSLQLLLARFLNPKYIHANAEHEILDLIGDDSDAKDPYEHFGSVLVNVTQVEAGRQFVLKLNRKSGQESLLQKLLPILLQPPASTSALRRRGVAGMVRNCCYDKDSAWWLLNVVNVTKYLLYPLAGECVVFD